MRSAAFHAYVRTIQANLARALSLLRYATGGTGSLEKQVETVEDADANYDREDVV